jgi:hypothetical protein
LQQRRRLGFHLADGPHQELLGAAMEAGPQDFIAAGGHQGIEPAGIGADFQAELQQPLEAMAPGFEPETVGPQQHRRVVAVVEGVGYAGAHVESAMK